MRQAGEPGVVGVPGGATGAWAGADRHAATSSCNAGATTAFVGLGANLGDASATLTAAIVALEQLDETVFGARSSFYLTAPVDAQGPDYLNAVVRLSTRLEPQNLLAELQRIEAVQGRERPFHHAPRTLDLDLLLYGTERIATPTLTVPHPRLHLRAFVVLPLLEIAPEAVIPGIGRAGDLLPRLVGQRVTRLPR